MKDSTKEFQLVNWFHQEPSLNGSLQMHVAWGIDKRSWRCVHACMAMILSASQGHRGITPVTEAWQWKDTGFLGRTDKVHEEAVFALCQCPAGVHGALPGDGRGVNPELMGQD